MCVFSDKEACLTWLKQNRDPCLWNQVVMGMNYDLPTTFFYLQWMVEQEDCDRAIAFSVLSMTGGYEYIYLKPRHTYEEVTFKIAQTICCNSKNAFYSSGELALDQNLSHDPNNMLEDIISGCKKKSGTKRRDLFAHPLQAFTGKL